MNIKSWNSLKKILKIKILQSQDYVNINNLTLQILLLLWHYSMKKTNTLNLIIYVNK